MPSTEFAGRLRHRLAVQVDSGTQNARGEEIENWATEATVFASIEPLAGRELFAAQQRMADVTHRIRMQYYPAGLTPKKRFLYGTRVFDILMVLNPEEIGREMQVLAREFV